MDVSYVGLDAIKSHIAENTTRNLQKGQKRSEDSQELPRMSQKEIDILKDEIEANFYVLPGKNFSTERAYQIKTGARVAIRRTDENDQFIQSKMAQDNPQDKVQNIGCRRTCRDIDVVFVDQNYPPYTSGAASPEIVPSRAQVLLAVSLHDPERYSEYDIMPRLKPEEPTGYCSRIRNIRAAIFQDLIQYYGMPCDLAGIKIAYSRLMKIQKVLTGKFLSNTRKTFSSAEFNAFKKQLLGVATKICSLAAQENFEYLHSDYKPELNIQARLVFLAVFSAATLPTTTVHVNFLMDFAAHYGIEIQEQMNKIFKTFSEKDYTYKGCLLPIPEELQVTAASSLKSTGLSKEQVVEIGLDCDQKQVHLGKRDEFTTQNEGTLAMEGVKFIKSESQASTCCWSSMFGFNDPEDDFKELFHHGDSPF